MPLRLSLCTLVIAFLAFMPSNASAQCEIGDLVCKKFKNGPTARKAIKRRAKVSRHRRARRTKSKTRTLRTVTATAIAATPVIATTNVESNASVPMARPLPTLTQLPPGAIPAAPASVTNLLFSVGDQVETVAGTCQPVDGSTRRVSCALATHRLAMTSEAGAGCRGALGVREMTFAQDDDGRWVNEDSIALCGGRLLRRSEMIPVAIDGKPRYALREAYQMLGGDSSCAAPYLRSRQPLRKSYLPASTQKSKNLRCGTVASR